MPSLFTGSACFWYDRGEKARRSIFPRRAFGMFGAKRHAIVSNLYVFSKYLNSSRLSRLPPDLKLHIRFAILLGSSIIKADI